MKKISVLGMAVCFLIICCLSLSEAVNIKRLIIGKWIENNRNSLELVEDGTAIIVEEGKSVAGNYKFLPDGRLKIDLGGFWGSKVFEISIDKEGRLNLKEPNGEVTKYLTEKAYKLQLDEGALKSKRSDGNYVVKVNSTVITREDLKREFESLDEYAQKMFQTEKGIFNLVEELVKKHMLYQEAKRKGLDKDPAYQKKVADSQGLILISSLLEKEIEDKAKVTDKDVKDFYKKNKADFSVQGKPVEFEKIKEMLTQRLTAQKQKEIFDSYIENLKKLYVIEINEKAVKAFQKSLVKK